MSVFEIILDSFDIRKSSTVCNEKNCDIVPDVKVELYRYELKKGKIPIGTLYVCKEHQKTVNHIVEQIKAAFPKDIIDKDVNNINE